MIDETIDVVVTVETWVTIAVMAVVILGGVMAAVVVLIVVIEATEMIVGIEVMETADMAIVVATEDLATVVVTEVMGIVDTVTEDLEVIVGPLTEEDTTVDLIDVMTVTTRLVPVVAVAEDTIDLKVDGVTEVEIIGVQVVAVQKVARTKHLVYARTVIAMIDHVKEVMKTDGPLSENNLVHNVCNFRKKINVILV